jgi:hypothetical protein
VANLTPSVEEQTEYQPNALVGVVSFHVSPEFVEIEMPPELLANCTPYTATIVVPSPEQATPCHGAVAAVGSQVVPPFFEM